MNLKELVPPLELCQQIPAGEFEDSAFIWDKTDTVGFWDGVDKDGNSIGGFGKIPAINWRVRQNFSERCRKRMKESGTVLNVYPAPTLQEILAVCKDIATLHPDPKYTKVFDLTKLTPQNTLEIYLSKTKKEPHNANC